jgi:hypothetical protein
MSIDSYFRLFKMFSFSTVNSSLKFSNNLVQTLQRNGFCTSRGPSSPNWIRYLTVCPKYGWNLDFSACTAKSESTSRIQFLRIFSSADVVLAARSSTPLAILSTNGSIYSARVLIKLDKTDTATSLT